jgi:hypothetical protein
MREMAASWETDRQRPMDLICEKLEEAMEREKICAE